MRIMLLLLPIVVCSCQAEMPLYAAKCLSPKPTCNSTNIKINDPTPNRVAELNNGVIQLVEHDPGPKHKTINVIATAYCPCARCCGRMSGKTSTNKNAWKPGVAADPRAIPYNTIIHVPGYDRADLVAVDDTGGAMRRAWGQGYVLIDVRMTYHWQARQWGRKELSIKVYE